jgi:hypothetical protein
MLPSGTHLFYIFVYGHNVIPCCFIYPAACVSAGGLRCFVCPAT